MARMYAYDATNLVKVNYEDDCDMFAYIQESEKWNSRSYRDYAYSLIQDAITEGVIREDWHDITVYMPDFNEDNKCEYRTFEEKFFNADLI